MSMKEQIKQWAVLCENETQMNESLFKLGLQKLKDVRNSLKDASEVVKNSISGEFAKTKSITKFLEKGTGVDKKNTKLAVQIADKFYPVINATKAADFIHGRLLVFGFDESKENTSVESVKNDAISISEMMKQLVEKSGLKDSISSVFETIFCLPQMRTDHKVSDIITKDTKMADIILKGDVIVFVYEKSQKDQEEADFEDRLWS